MCKKVCGSSVVELRRAALDEAQRELAICLETESQAEAAAGGLERGIFEQTTSAANSDTDDDVEAFGIWFKTEWRQLMAARRLLENLQAETTRERAIVTACRNALERCRRCKPPESRALTADQM